VPVGKLVDCSRGRVSEDVALACQEADQAQQLRLACTVTAVVTSSTKLWIAASLDAQVNMIHSATATACSCEITM
jgi:hypothetical protein